MVISASVVTPKITSNMQDSLDVPPSSNDFGFFKSLRRERWERNSGTRGKKKQKNHFP